MFIPYTYIVVHSITGEYYIGSKTKKECNPENTLEYLGSPSKSSYYATLIQTERHLLRKYVIARWSTAEEALAHEVLLHYHLVGLPLCLNMAKQLSTRFAFVKEHSPQSRKKMSDARLGRPQSEETRLAISRATKGKPKSEEFKRKLSASRKGKPLSQANKDALSRATKGKPKPRKKVEQLNVS